MLRDLKQYKNHSKNELMKDYVQQRLNKSYATYQKELIDNYKQLLTQNELKVIKNLSKEIKNES